MVREGFDSSNLVPIVYESNFKKYINKIIIVIIIIFLLLLLLYFIFKRPTIIFNGDKIEKISYQNEFIDSGITVKYHGKDITDKVTSSNNVDTSKLGEYKIIYEIPYTFGTYTYTRKVMVVDDISPELILQGDQEYKLSYKKDYQEPGYQAIDNCDGDITDKVEITTNQISDTEMELNYKVEDSSGNKQEITRKVIIVDDIKPDMELIGDGTIYLSLGEEYQEQGAEAVDEKDGDLTDKIEITGDVNTNQEGTYIVTYTVSDTKSNTAIVTREVIVERAGTATMNIGTPGTIYLTFDDGPTTSVTPQILSILQEKDIKATFFILDYGEKTEYLVKQIVDEGHSIGIHGFSHDYSVAYSSPNAYLDGLDYMRNKIKQSTGTDTNLIRFPGGSSNTISRKYYQGAMTILTTESVKRGYRYFDWNVLSGDSGNASTAEEVYNNVINGLKLTRANVVLMHDFSENNKTLEALPSIIDYGLENGYTFEKITEKTPMITQNVQN